MTNLQFLAGPALTGRRALSARANVLQSKG